MRFAFLTLQKYFYFQKIRSNQEIGDLLGYSSETIRKKINKIKNNTIAYELLTLIPGIVILINDIILSCYGNDTVKHFTQYKYITHGCNNLIIARDIKAYKKAYNAMPKAEPNHVVNNSSANNKPENKYQ